MSSSLREKQPNLQVARVHNDWVQNPQKVISALCPKKAEIMKGGDRPNGFLKAVESRLVGFNRERPFLTKRMWFFA